jgi:hypothetical protein
MSTDFMGFGAQFASSPADYSSFLKSPTTPLPAMKSQKKLLTSLTLAVSSVAAIAASGTWTIANGRD